MEPNNTQPISVSTTGVYSQQEISNQQTSFPSPDSNKTKRTIVRFFQAIGFVAYLPVAFLIFAFSGMAGDSPYANPFVVLMTIIGINGGFFLIVMTAIYLYGKVGEKLMRVIESSFPFGVAMFLVAIFFLVFLGNLFPIIISVFGLISAIFDHS